MATYFSLTTLKSNECFKKNDCDKNNNQRILFQRLLT